MTIDYKAFEGHTPGGWSRNIKPASKYPIIFAGRNTHVAQVCTSGLTESEVEANCALIAAAPALLAENERLRAALKVAEKYLSKAVSDGFGADCVMPLQDKPMTVIRAALANKPE